MSMYKNVCFTSRAHVQLLLQDLVLAPEESHLIGQLTLLVVAVDEDVGGCWTRAHTHSSSQQQRHECFLITKQAETEEELFQVRTWVFLHLGQSFLQLFPEKVVGADALLEALPQRSDLL